MKKIVLLLLAVTMVFAFAGCQKTELTRGTFDGSIYKNDLMHFEFEKPESWVYSTDEEIAATLNVGVEYLGKDSFKNALKNNPSVYDMMVVDTITRTNINVGYENLAKTLSSNITVEQYIEALKQQLADVSAMKVTFPDKYDTVTLGKTEFTRVVCDVTASGASMTQVYYLHKMDGYMGFIIVTLVSGYTVADVEAMFK